MDWNGVVGLVGGLAGGIALIWGTFRKERRADVQAEIDAAKAKAEVDANVAHADRAEDATALDQWRKYSQDREKQHNSDISRLEKKIGEQQLEIMDMIKRERDCLIAHAEAKVEREHLLREVEKLRLDVRRALPGTGGDSGTLLKGS